LIKYLNILFLILSGCATYQNKVSPARNFLAQGQCDLALKNLEELSNKTGGDQLVYSMDYGSALQICGDYKKSNSIFLRAEKLVDENDYTSVSRSAGATLLNEEVLQYRGDTFEKLFLNVSLALNFIQLHDFDSALIEVRKMNQKFVKLNNENKKKFELNSFSKYLSGLVWEADRKYDDACIDFKDAYFLDTNYRSVGQDMLRTCWKANRSDEFRTLAKKMSATEDEIKKSKDYDKTELILIFMQGWGPRKAPRPTDSISPYLVPVYSQTQQLKAEINNKNYLSQSVYSVESAAIQTLNDDYGSLIARRLAARAAKEVLASQIRQKDNLLGAVAWLAMVASERADLRQWSIFPKTFQIIRIPVVPGENKIKLTGLDSAGSASEQMPELMFKINSGEKKFQIIRSLK
jgi:uncharacterized protein